MPPEWGARYMTPWTRARVRALRPTYDAESPADHSAGRTVLTLGNPAYPNRAVPPILARFAYGFDDALLRE
ncbi:hypothetical protein [Streptomyces sp. NPDC004014]